MKKLFYDTVVPIGEEFDDSTIHEWVEGVDWQEIPYEEDEEKVEGRYVGTWNGISVFAIEGWGGDFYKFVDDEDGWAAADAEKTADFMKRVRGAQKGTKSFSADKTPIYTVDIKDEATEDSIENMKYVGRTYYDMDEAVAAAIAAAKEYSMESHLIIAYVFAGEYEDKSGDVYGEPEAVYAASNHDKRTTINERIAYGFCSAEVDYYAE